MAKAKKDAYQTFLESVRKDFGEDTIQDLGSMLGEIDPEDYISTGVPKFDQMLGGLGYRRGRLHILSGREGSGKSTLCLSVCKQAQLRGMRCLYIDVEASLNPTYAECLGVDTSQEMFVYSQPVAGEDCYTLVERAAKSNQFGVIVIDSLSALASRAELEGEMDDAQVASAARVNSKGLRKVIPLISKSNTILMGVAQLRDNIGSMGYGPKTKITGGHAIKYAAVTITSVNHIGQIKDGDNVIGSKTRLKLDKSKQSSPRQETEVPLIYGLGFEEAYGAFELGLKAGHIERKGAWYTYEGNRYQGQANFVQALRADPAMLQSLKDLF